MAREYRENMSEWVSKTQYQNLSDSVKDAYISFCNWWEDNHKKITTWSEIPKDILEVWKLIRKDGYPDFVLVSMGMEGKIGLMSSFEDSLD